MNAIPADTTIDALKKQFQVLRRMDTAGRAEMTFELSDNLREIVKAGIRYRHPDYDERSVTLAVLRLTIEPQLFQEAFGDIDIQP